MQVAFQCDPFETLNPATDSTLALMEEAARRGMRLFCYTPEDLQWRAGALTARAFPVSFQETGPQNLSTSKNLFIAREVLGSGARSDAVYRDIHEDTRTCLRQGFGKAGALTTKLPAKRVLRGAQLIRGASPITLQLAEMDIIWIRQDPPFDMGYLTPTYLLETLPKKVLILNAPGGIRGAPEKLLITHFPDLLPATLITACDEAALEFLHTHGTIVIKPLYEYGGRAITQVQTPADLQKQWAHLQALYPRQPFLCQTFLPEVFEGDKRLFLIEGTYAGGFKKMPSKGDFRSNLVAGGQAVAYHANDRDREICERLGPTLRERGLFFVGIDVIGSYLTEINVTSPTGLRAYEKLYHTKLEHKIWDTIGTKLDGLSP